jgi:rhodanese-related sulfurtransferase
VPRISIQEANQVHGNSNVIFIDVRTAKSWWRSSAKIPDAIREQPDAVEQWAPKYDKNKTLILYCA